MSVIKILVRAGAQVDHPTCKLSTPLRAAVYGGRLDIAEYLVAHGADINSANNYNNTCLMLAAFKVNSCLSLTRGDAVSRFYLTRCGLNFSG